jgi:hypothetical protein
MLKPDWRIVEHQLRVLSPSGIWEQSIPGGQEVLLTAYCLSSCLWVACWEQSTPGGQEVLLTAYCLRSCLWVACWKQSIPAVSISLCDCR